MKSTFFIVPIFSYFVFIGFVVHAQDDRAEEEIGLRHLKQVSGQLMKCQRTDAPARNGARRNSSQQLQLRHWELKPSRLEPLRGGTKRKQRKNEALKSILSFSVQIFVRTFAK